MTTTPIRQQLLYELCDLIRDPDTAALIRAMDPDDHITFAEAYCALRTSTTFTPALRKRVLAEVYTLADLETRRVLVARAAAS